MNDLIFEITILYKIVFPEKIMTDPILAIKEIQDWFDVDRKGSIQNLEMKIFELKQKFNDIKEIVNGD